MKIIIDTDELTHLRVEGDKLVLESQAETVLTRILELEGQIAEIKEAAKEKLAEEGKKLNPNFKSWEADTIKVAMRAYGAKYFVDEGNIDLAPKELFKTEATVVTPNTRLEEIIEALDEAGYPIATTKGKDGSVKFVIKRTVDTKSVDKWIKMWKSLPTGIGEFKERPISLTFGLKSREEHEKTD